MRIALLTAMLLAPLHAAVCGQVDHEVITAADLAMQVPAFIELNPAVSIGPSPMPGVIRMFPERELAAIAAANQIVFDGPAQEICFIRALKPLNEGQVEAAIRSRLTGRNLTIQIVDYLRTALPSGVLEFPESGRAAASTESGAPVLWRGSLRYAPARTAPVWALVRVHQEYPAVVAARDIRAGAQITPDDVKLVSRSLSPFTQHFDTVDAVAGHIAKKRIALDTPLTAHLLETPPDVAAGDSLLVVATNGQARIKFHAVARSTGRKGDRIVLLNPESNRTFRAVLDGRGQAHVGAAE